MEYWVDVDMHGNHRVSPFDFDAFWIPNTILSTFKRQNMNEKRFIFY